MDELNAGVCVGYVCGGVVTAKKSRVVQVLEMKEVTGFNKGKRGPQGSFKPSLSARRPNGVAKRG